MKTRNVRKIYNNDELEHILEEIGIGSFQLVAVIGFGSRLFARGSFYSLTALLEPYYHCLFGLTHFSASLYVSLQVPCAGMTSCITGLLVERFGKKRSIILLCLMGLYLTLLNTLSSSYVMIVITTCSIQLFENSKYFVYPYMLEMLPKSQRKYFTLAEGFYVVGFLAGIFLTRASILYLQWQWAVVSCLVLPIALSVTILAVAIPESPRYLLSVNQVDRAIDALVQIATRNSPNLDKNVLYTEYKGRLFDFEHIDKQMRFEDPPELASSAGEELPRNRYDYADQNSNPKKESCTPRRFGCDASKDAAKSEKFYEKSGDETNWWFRVGLVSFLFFVNQLCRGAMTYGSSQMYGGGTHTLPPCGQQCYSTMATQNTVSVGLGMLLALPINYSIIGRSRRRTALLFLFTATFLSMYPVYFRISTVTLACFYFLWAVLTETLFMFLLLYSSEIVPTKNRALALGFSTLASMTGQLVGILLATYLFHKHLYIGIVAIHSTVFLSILSVYFFAIETKDSSLH